nr:hypothetical protein [Tanacetum cinerariifolium]
MSFEGRLTVVKLVVGAPTLFWEDRWFGDIRLRERFPRLLQLDRCKKARVVNRWRWDSWSWNLTQDEDGNFKVKDLAFMVDDVCLSMGNTTEEILWNKLAPKNVESYDHRLGTCNVAKSVWDKNFEWWKISLAAVGPNTPSDGLGTAVAGPGRPAVGLGKPHAAAGPHKEHAGLDNENHDGKQDSLRIYMEWLGGKFVRGVKAAVGPNTPSDGLGTAVAGPGRPAVGLGKPHAAAGPHKEHAWSAGV